MTKLLIARQKAAIAMLIMSDPVIGFGGSHPFARPIRALVNLQMLGFAFTFDYDADKIMRELDRRLQKYHSEEVSHA